MKTPEAFNAQFGQSMPSLFDEWTLHRLEAPRSPRRWKDGFPDTQSLIDRMHGEEFELSEPVQEMRRFLENLTGKEVSFRKERLYLFDGSVPEWYPIFKVDKN